MGKLVVVEGADKVGKETQSKLLEQSLRRAGTRAVRVEPTKESHPRGRRLIYSMLESGAAKRYPNLFQLVQFANRAYFQLFKLPGLLRSNDVVILDRWALSGYVYGKSEVVNRSLNAWMYKRAQKADLVIVFGGTSYKRQQLDDSYERDMSLQIKVRAAYTQAGRDWPGHVLIDNRGSVQEVQDEVLLCLRQRKIIPEAR